MSDFIIKDSGERVTFKTGAQRDALPGKGFFHLIPYLPHLRLAQLYEGGSKKYSANNWKKGMPLSCFIDSASRHLGKLAENWADEDHATAVSWNMFGYIWTKNEIEQGRLPAELDDVGHCKIISSVKLDAEKFAKDTQEFEEAIRGIIQDNLGEIHGR